jgi:uncharacterized protein YecE (DUF72 family)
MATRLFVGTSGFSYDEWKPAFYPADLLPAVELNNTFYRMPSPKLCAKWSSEVPAGFCFAVKASQRITWTQKLKDCGELLARLSSAVGELGDKLGCVFYQLPKWVRKDVPLLQEFLALQQRDIPVAFEFAHAAVVRSDKDDADTPELIDTGTWCYLRLRRAEYSDDALRGWHERIAARGLQRCFVFFKHEDSCAGPALARRFLDLQP